MFKIRLEEWYKLKDKTSKNLIFALFISIGIIVYSYYTGTLLWGIYGTALIIIFTLLWSKIPNLKEKKPSVLIIGKVIAIGLLIYSFYMGILLWGIIYATLVMIITVLFITFFWKSPLKVDK